MFNQRIYSTSWITVCQDTWASYAGQTSEQSRVTHGTFFYLAQEEGLMGNNSIHAGIRCKLGVSSGVRQYP